MQWIVMHIWLHKGLTGYEILSLNYIYNRSEMRSCDLVYLERPTTHLIPAAYPPPSAATDG
jgi:hypothetical protein